MVLGPEAKHWNGECEILSKLRPLKRRQDVLEESPEDEVEDALRGLEQKAPHVTLEDGPDTMPGQFQLPAWFDNERYRRGAAVFEDNPHSLFQCKLAGLVSLLAIPSILRVLVLTNKSGTAATAWRRYLDTVRHMIYWYRADLLDPKSPARESFQAVRSHHLGGSTAAKRAGMTRISQYDLAVTQFAFCGFVILYREKLSIHASRNDLLDFLHFWRTIGYLVGIQDRFNLCRFDTDLECSERLLAGVRSRVLGPAMTSPPEEFWPMSRALLDGLWCVMPVLEYDSFIRFVQQCAGVAEDALWPLKTLYSQFIFWLLYWIPFTMSLPVVGPLVRTYFNYNIWFTVYMSTRNPLLAWYSFPGNKITSYNRLISTAD